MELGTPTGSADPGKLSPPPGDPMAMAKVARLNHSSTNPRLTRTFLTLAKHGGIGKFGKLPHELDDVPLKVHHL